MMQWKKEALTLTDGTCVEAQAPIILSASRATDIPAFYGDWFVKRWKQGYLRWTNPFNGQPLYVSLKNVRCVVFWSKNPRAFMKHLEWCKQHIPNFYFQFSLNDYVNEAYEAKVPSVESRIKTFKELSNTLGKERVIWRYDPLLLTETLHLKELLARVN